MVKEIKIPIENKAQIEEVGEIDNKYQIPTFEEFMKTYESDSNLNYDDLRHSDMGDSKSYGPCHSCGSRNLTFELAIILKKWDGVKICGTVYSTVNAERAAREIRNGTGFWEGDWKTGPFSDSSRHALANQVMNYVDRQKNGESINTTTSYEDSCSIT